MSIARQCRNSLTTPLRTVAAASRPRFQTSQTSELHEVDDYGIPKRPTWSLNDLLSSYPKPTISSSTLDHLYRLSALNPPQEGTHEYAKIQGEMEDLVKLVEAVKLVDVGQVGEQDDQVVPDGRIWAEGTGISLSREVTPEHSGSDGSHGRELLKHAQKTADAFYVVPRDSRRASQRSMRDNDGNEEEF